MEETLMIDLGGLKRIAISEGVPQAIVEKDLALSLALKSISQSRLMEHLVFKGGTAIRKGYFERARFSEDLDFKSSGAGRVKCLGMLREALEGTDSSGFRFEKIEDEGNRAGLKASVRFKGTWETDANPHGVFTFNHLSEMRRRAKEKQRVFTMLDLFSSIQSKVLVDSKNRQIPQINQFFTEGQMLFFTTGDKPAPEKPPVGGAVPTTDPGKKLEIAKLSVKSNPAGAKVFVDDEEVGETPLTKEYELEKNRKVEVRLELEGYEVLFDLIAIKEVMNNPFQDQFIFPSNLHRLPPSDNLPTAAWEVVSLSVMSADVSSPAGLFRIGEEILVTSLVRNSGLKSGTAEVVLEIDGAPASSQGVALPPGEDVPVRFVLIVPRQGIYTVSLDNLAQSLSVTE